jgi:hypothetical protein
MHTGTLKKLALALTFWLAVHAGLLRAQTFTAPLQASTTGTNPVDFEFRADGTLIAKGNYGVGDLLSGDDGAGTRMFWLPGYGAFRAGGTDTSLGIYTANNWDPSNLGAYSAAFGLDTAAIGDYSAAFGDYALAESTGSFATGESVSASGNYSVAMGQFLTVSGNNSVAFGKLNTASGYGSTASGTYNSASGGGSTVTGGSNIASGYYTTASGYYTTAMALASFVTGVFNVGGGNPSTWVSTDPLFEIGNGTSSSALSDALVVYKNGNVTAQGVITAAPGGNIPMYTGE